MSETTLLKTGECVPFGEVPIGAYFNPLYLGNRVTIFIKLSKSVNVSFDGTNLRQMNSVEGTTGIMWNFPDAHPVHVFNNIVAKQE